MKYSLLSKNTLPKVTFIVLALFIMSVDAYSQEYDVMWKYTQGIDYDTTNNIITKTENNGWNNCGAISYNRLKRNKDGYLKYVITDIDTKKAFGLSTNNNNPRLRSIDYGFVLNNNKILIVEHGRLKGNYGKIKIGDSLRIERNNNKIKYYKNNILLRNKGTNPNFKLYVDVSINSSGASFRGFKTSFAKNLRILYTKKDVDCFANQNNGEISLAINGGVSPYNIIWSTGQTTQVITNLSKGKYTVTVTDQLGLEKTKTISINTAILWKIDSGIVIVNDSLQKTAINGWGNAGAQSYNKIDSLKDGYLTFTIDKPWVKKAVGFSSRNINSHFNTIEHCFVISNNKLFIYESGHFKGKFGKVKKGTVLEIRKQGDKFYYYKNGKLKKTTNGDLTKQYIVDISMYKQNSFLEPIFVDFCPKIEEIEINYTTEMNACDSGSIYLSVIGGIPPYTYSWSDGSSDSLLLNVPKGEYSITVTDFVETHKKGHITLLPNLIWTDLEGVEVKENSLIKIAKDGWGNGGAASENILLADEDGFVSCILKNHDTKVIGLSHTNTDAHYKNINYGFFSSKDQIYIIENGYLVGKYGYWKIQVKLKIEKRNDRILYWVNDKVVRKTEIKEPKSLLVDVSLYDQGSYFNDVKVSFCRYEPLMISYVIHNVTRDSMGYISLTILNGQPPYTYSWSNGSTYNPNYNLEAGLYSVTVKDDDERQYEISSYLLSTIYWKNITGIDDDTLGNLFKNLQQSGWNAGASSRNILSWNTDGMIRYIPNDSTGFKMFGFSLLDTSLEISNINYGYYFDNGIAYIYESGDSIMEAGNCGEGDSFDIIREDTTIMYEINGELIRNISVDPSEELVVDVSIYTPDATMDNIQASFTNYPFITINTLGLDDSLTYIITGGGLNDTIYTNTVETFWINRVVDDSTGQFYLTFSDQTELRFYVDTTYSITNVEYLVSGNNYASYNKNLYQTYKKNLILYKNELILPDFIGYSDVYPNLEGGLLMSPDGDKQYDDFVVEGLDGVETYSIKIYDSENNLVFSSTDKSIVWDGKDMRTSELVDTGTFKYDIVANSVKFSGQFLIEY